jgi:hypothetical protein
VVYADNVIVSDVTLDSRTHQAQAAFATGHASNVVLNHCKILGSDHMFGIFFAGPNLPIGDATVSAVENKQLDEHNKIINCTVESNFIGDGVSFSLQKNGIVHNNLIKGTKLAFYMCVDSFVINNTFENSNSSGIFYNIPALDNVIAQNTILNAEGSGIKIALQGEHPVSETYRGTNLKVFNNTIIAAGHFGIDINNLRQSLIVNNHIEASGTGGMYLLRAEYLTIKKNLMKNPGRGAHDGTLIEGWPAFLVGGILADPWVEDCIFDENIIENTLTNCAFALRINPLNYRHSIINNKIRGPYANNRILSGEESMVSIKVDLLDRLALIAVQ